MPAKLAADEDTVSVEFKLPASLKSKALTMARLSGDGDLSSWLRELIRCEWKRQDGRTKK
jgi:hypothetical protein